MPEEKADQEKPDAAVNAGTEEQQPRTPREVASEMSEWILQYEKLKGSGGEIKDIVGGDLGASGLDNTLTIRTDTATPNDKLGRAELADTLAQMISSPLQRGPLTIGIFGDWGSGKSSLLEMLKAKLKVYVSKNEQYVVDVAELNVWQYEHVGSISAALAHKVAEACHSSNRWRNPNWSGSVKSNFPMQCLQFFFSRLKLICQLRGPFAIWKHWAAILWILFVLLLFVPAILGILIVYFGITNISDSITIPSILFYLIVLLFVSPKLTSVFEFLGKIPWGRVYKYLKYPEYKAQMGEWPVMSDDIKMLSELMLVEKRKLVILIDDLDRCNDDAIVECLEAVRLLLNHPNIYVVIALDSEVTMNAIAKTYSLKEITDQSARNIPRFFLGKIIQLPIRLENPSVRRLIPYIADLFEPTPPDKDQKSDDKFLQPSEDEMIESTEELALFTLLVQGSGIDNPRQILRLRNAYRLLKKYPDIVDDESRKRGATQFSLPSIEVLMIAMFLQEVMHEHWNRDANELWTYIDTGKVPSWLADTACEKWLPVVGYLLNTLDDVIFKSTDHDRKLNDDWAFFESICGISRRVILPIRPRRKQDETEA